MITKLHKVVKKKSDSRLAAFIFQSPSSVSYERKEILLTSDRQTQHLTELGSLTLGRYLGDKTRVAGTTRTIKPIQIPFAKHASNGQQYMTYEQTELSAKHHKRLTKF